MNITGLKSRWETTEGREKVRDIIKALKDNASLENYAEKINDKWDLRGIKLAEPKLKEQLVSNYSIIINENILEFKNARLQGIDFSFSDLSYSLWTKCEFVNLTLFNTKATNIRFWACKMKSSIVEKTNFSNSLLGGRLKTDSGSFEDVNFKNDNFKSTVYSFPLFKNCVFENCNLDEVNFDGSRFESCIFKGRLYSTIFRGITTDYKKGVFWEKSINPSDFPNQMKNIDFTGAELNGVSFINGVDLSSCKLPSSGDYLLVSNLEHLYKKAKGIISVEWAGENRRIGLEIIDSVYYTKNHKSQKQDIIDKKFLTEQFGFDFADKFYALIAAIHTSS
jgi:uncharacterized protein YjbI with pentapeptide repeats